MAFTLQGFLDEAKAVAAKLKQVDYVNLIDKAYNTVEVVEALNGVTRNSTKVSDATAKAKVVLNVANVVAGKIN